MTDNAKKWDKIKARYHRYISLEKRLSDNTIAAYMRDLEHRAVTILGRKVRILKNDKKKVIELAYSDDEDLEALLKTICGENFFDENE